MKNLEESFYSANSLESGLFSQQDDVYVLPTPLAPAQYPWIDDERDYQVQFYNAPKEPSLELQQKRIAKIFRIYSVAFKESGLADAAWLNLARRLPSAELTQLQRGGIRIQPGRMPEKPNKVHLFTGFYSARNPYFVHFEHIGITEDEVVEQTFVFTDRGGRTVTLRPEMTPTVSRMVAAKRQELAYPLRWYSIPNLWRYERPQAGRLREHWQLNVDLFGVAGLAADHELILVADQILKTFGAKESSYQIKVNSRQLMNWYLTEKLQLDRSQIRPIMRLLDRIDKISAKEFTELLETMLDSADKAKQLQQFLNLEKLADAELDVRQHPAAQQLVKLLDLLEASGVSNAVFSPQLARGFEYYTDIVFEIFDTHPDNNRSMIGGGRYDGLLGVFGVEPIPTVGFGMGDVTLQRFLELHKLLPKLEPETDAVVILIGEVYDQTMSMLNNFRKEGVRLAVDATSRKLDSKMKSAVKSGVQFVIFIGADEIANQRFKLKDLKSGEEKDYSFERLVSKLAARHKKIEDID